MAQPSFSKKGVGLRKLSLFVIVGDLLKKKRTSAKLMVKVSQKKRSSEKFLQNFLASSKTKWKVLCLGGWGTNEKKYSNGILRLKVY